MSAMRGAGLSFASGAAMLFLACALAGGVAGCGFFAMVAAHEYGHWIALRRRGCEPRHPVYALIVAWVKPDIPPRPRDWFAVAFAGPLLGGALTIVCFAASFVFPNLGIVAWFGAMLNALNLLPIFPLDGGRMLAANWSKRIAGYVGFPLAVFWLWRAPDILIGLCALASLSACIAGKRTRYTPTFQAAARTLAHVSAIGIMLGVAFWSYFAMPCVGNLGAFCGLGK